MARTVALDTNTEPASLENLGKLWMLREVLPPLASLDTPMLATPNLDHARRELARAKKAGWEIRITPEATARIRTEHPEFA